MKSKKIYSLLLVGAFLCTSNVINAQAPMQLVSSQHKYYSDSFALTYKYANPYASVTPMYTPQYYYFIDNESSYVSPLMNNNADTIIKTSNNNIYLQANTYTNKKLSTSTEFQNDTLRALTTYTYHANGSLATSDHVYYYDDGRVAGRRLYEYFDDGRDKGSIYWTDEDNGVKYKTIKVYEYNNAKQLLSSYTMMDSIENQPSYSSIGLDSVVYTYSNATTLLPSKKEKYGISYSNNQRDITRENGVNYFDYNAQNKLAIDSNVNNGEFYIYKYEYSGDTTIEYAYYGDIGVNYDTSSMYKYVKNAIGDKIYYEKHFYSNGQYEFDYKYYHVYNNNNLLTDYFYVRNGANSYASSEDSIHIDYNANHLPTKFATADGEVEYTWTYQNAETEEDPNAIFENLKFDVAIYPNPSNGIITINVGDLKDYDVILYNATGQLLGHYNNVSTIDMTYRANGQYLMKIIDNNSNLSIIRKVVKN
jgi:hypothetical protein